MRTRYLMMPLMAGLLLSACSTNNLGDSRDLGNSREMTNTQKSAIIGTVSGAALGPVIHHKNRGKGALIGAVGGGLAGTGVGYYMDQQAKDLEKQLQTEIQRGEITIERRASDDALLVSMTPSTGFDNLSSVIKPGYLSTLNKIAQVLNQYGKTMMTVISHTDSVGPNENNQRLSERRAQSVIDYFTNQNINPIRLQSYGKGESEQIGRASCRERV